jgi:molybdopterin synthase sulfur carrier subunit
MATIRFTQNIQRHVQCPPREVSGGTLREALEDYFGSNQAARGYVLDDQGRLRQHMAAFIDGRQVADRESLSDPVQPDAVIDVVQSLSGGCC